MSSNTWIDLLNQQEAERQALAAGAYKAWSIVREKEKQFLAPFGGRYEHVPHDVQDTLNNERQNYFEEWGSDGKLAVLMAEKHEKEREKLMRKQEIIEQLQTDLGAKKDRGRGR